MSARELRLRLGRWIAGQDVKRPPGFQIGGVGYARPLVPAEQAQRVRVSGMKVMRETYRRLDIPARGFDLARYEFVGSRPVDEWAIQTEISPEETYDLLRSEAGEQLARLVVGGRPNAFVNLGLHFVLDRIFNINTPNAAISHMGISDDTTAVTASTTQLDPTAAGDSPAIRALGTGTGASATSRTAETVTCSAGWAETDFTTVFSITKTGLLNTSTDAADDTVPTVQGIMNIIGGTGGASPYDEPFTIDLTNVDEFDLTLSEQITASAT